MYLPFRMAVSALQNIVTNYPDWRTAIVRGFANFILREVPDSCPLVLEGALKTLGQLLGHWRGLVTGGGQEELPLQVLCEISRKVPSDAVRVRERGGLAVGEGQ